MPGKKKNEAAAFMNAMFNQNEPQEKKEAAETKPPYQIGPDGLPIDLSDAEIEELTEATKTVYDWKTMSFRVREDRLEMLRDYAYTERIGIKDALDEALSEYLFKKMDEYRESGKVLLHAADAKKKRK